MVDLSQWDRDLQRPPIPINSYIPRSTDEPEPKRSVTTRVLDRLLAADLSAFGWFLAGVGVCGTVLAHGLARVGLVSVLCAVGVAMLVRDAHRGDP